MPNKVRHGLYYILNPFRILGYYIQFPNQNQTHRKNYNLNSLRCTLLNHQNRFPLVLLFFHSEGEQKRKPFFDVTNNDWGSILWAQSVDKVKKMLFVATQKVLQYDNNSERVKP